MGNAWLIVRTRVCLQVQHVLHQLFDLVDVTGDGSINKEEYTRLNRKLYLCLVITSAQQQTTNNA